jgi:glycosyltransferase involved in cell wall biosynthesis
VIGIHPYELRENSYIARNKKILGRVGTVVDVPRARLLLKALVKRIIRLKTPKLYDVLIINWPENVIVSPAGTPTLGGILDYFIALQLYRIASVKLIYVRHNELPHGVLKCHRKKLKSLITRGQNFADIVVAHSPVYARDHGYHYVPHPLYSVELCASSNEDYQYVIFGRVKKYKKIHELIRAWGQAHTLTVVGPCDDAEYLSELRTLAKGKPIGFDIGSHDEAEMAAKLSQSRGIVVVNDPGSLIVSGTFFFAVSCGVAVCTINDPFYDWIKTTGLGKFVVTSDSIQVLAQRLETTDSAKPNNGQKIRSEALKLFGDEHVLLAWRALFD